MRAAHPDELDLDTKRRDAISLLLALVEDGAWDDVKQVILYGHDAQPARGTLDLFVVFDAGRDRGRVTAAFPRAAARVRTETGVHIAIQFLPADYLEEIRDRASPLFRDLEREAVVLARPGEPRPNR